MAAMRTWRQFGKAEKIALAFFQSIEPYPHAKSPGKIKNLLTKLDYILFEGTLKTSIIQSGVFSPEQTDYLQRNTAALCQCAEFFMNGFKFGHTALGLSFKDYIIAVDPEKPFRPFSKSTVLYPESYGELYSLDSPVARCFKNCFKLDGQICSSITVWEVTCL